MEEAEADKFALRKIAKYLNYAAAVVMLVDVVFRFFNFGETSDPFYYLLTFYLIGFAVLLVIAEARIRRVLVYIEFLSSRLGKGIYGLFVGLLIFDTEFTCDLITGMAVFIIGLYNVIISFTKKDKGQGKDSDSENEARKEERYEKDESLK
mmetsp:Transcript_36999/g.35717  ORF Transcript_36999/g.35717 Transcript_36999/m.35717 type:complete len:151 (-) Transcript_36999:56-508(-)|eukprot:CAMPEP_0170556834 /NCGR_PEP_ID=MMETSP0211-20121228/18948_1 /TAXON_ID=311385 /ORGANISM="Pseudokeronopsis sp., Strain OXSARD2" /LENGTH=150 /DNA_ID=CAMNT_0010867405 /DNA_START=17 /DNA_END=469 /DNA_ORIENTATION=+